MTCCKPPITSEIEAVNIPAWPIFFLVCFHPLTDCNSLSCEVSFIHASLPINYHWSMQQGHPGLAECRNVIQIKHHQILWHNYLRCCKKFLKKSFVSKGTFYRFHDKSWIGLLQSGFKVCKSTQQTQKEPCGSGFKAFQHYYSSSSHSKCLLWRLWASKNASMNKSRNVNDI